VAVGCARRPGRTAPAVTGRCCTLPLTPLRDVREPRHPEARWPLLTRDVEAARAAPASVGCVGCRTRGGGGGSGKRTSFSISKKTFSKTRTWNTTNALVATAAAAAAGATGIVFAAGPIFQGPSACARAGTRPRLLNTHVVARPEPSLCKSPLGSHSTWRPQRAPSTAVSEQSAVARRPPLTPQRPARPTVTPPRPRVSPAHAAMRWPRLPRSLPATACSLSPPALPPLFYCPREPPSSALPFSSWRWARPARAPSAWRCPSRSSRLPKRPLG